MAKEITGAPTFTHIRQAFEGAKGAKHLRADEGGNRLYTHSSWKKSGIGQAAADRRAAKHQRGAKFLKQAIDREYGRGFGDRIFKKIHAQHPRVRLDQGIQVVDLGHIAHAIQAEQFRAPHLGSAGVGPGPVPYNRQESKLLTTLNHPQGFWDFYRFCEKDYSSESPEFWSRVEAWKNMPEDDILQQSEKTVIAKGIVARFATVGSPRQVNLEPVAKFEALKEAAEKDDLDKLKALLGEAQDEIFMNMFKDSFNRFKSAQD